MNPPGCPGLELLLLEVRMTEGGGVRAPLRSLQVFDEVRVTMLAAVPQGCERLPALVVPAQRGLVPQDATTRMYAPTKRLEARGLLVAGTPRFVFGWDREPKRVSIDLQSGEARIEEDGVTVASGGTFRESSPLVPPKYTRHALGVRLPGVASSSIEGPGHVCMQYFDLAIDDVFVARRTLSNGEVFDEVLVEAGYLQSELRSATECRARAVLSDVHLEVEGTFSLEPVALTRNAYWAIAFSGFDRVVRRFRLTPGTRSVRLAFSENDLVEVDLEAGTASVVRFSPARVAAVPGPHDVRRLWESRESDRPGYLRATYLRSHPARAAGQDVCTELLRGLEPTYVPGGETEALWELHAALKCEPPK